MMVQNTQKYLTLVLKGLKEQQVVITSYYVII